MELHVYRIKLTNADLLNAIGLESWHRDVAAHDMPSAWRKFNTCRMAPAYRFALDPAAVADDYDITYAGTHRLQCPMTELSD